MNTVEILVATRNIVHSCGAKCLAKGRIVAKAPGARVYRNISALAGQESSRLPISISEFYDCFREASSEEIKAFEDGRHTL